MLSEAQARGPIRQFMFDFILSMSVIHPAQIRVRERQGIIEIGTNKTCFQAERYTKSIKNSYIYFLILNGIHNLCNRLT